MRTVMALASVVVLAGCGASWPVAIGTSPVADVSAAYGDPKPEEVRAAPRAGVVYFMGTDGDVPARPTVGLYTRFFETDDRRVEVAVDIVPSFADERTNLYTSITGGYVGFIGGGSFFWKGGGGVALEERGDAQYATGLLEVGVGLWLSLKNERALLLASNLQLPITEAHPSGVLSLALGYERQY